MINLAITLCFFHTIITETFRKRRQWINDIFNYSKFLYHDKFNVVDMICYICAYQEVDQVPINILKSTNARDQPYSIYLHEVHVLLIFIYPLISITSIIID